MKISSNRELLESIESPKFVFHEARISGVPDSRQIFMTNKMKTLDTDIVYLYRLV